MAGGLGDYLRTRRERLRPEAVGLPAGARRRVPGAAFLEPGMRELYVDWAEMTAKSVAYLRAVVGADTDDPRLTELIGELSVRSERFRLLWDRQDVRRKTSGRTRLRHPQVGPLELHYEKLALPGAPGQMLVTYHAVPGTPTYERLQLLAHLAEHRDDPVAADPRTADPRTVSTDPARRPARSTGGHGGLAEPGPPGYK